MTTELSPDEWRALSGLDEELRQRAMHQRFEEMLAMEAPERIDAVERMLLGEQELDDGPHGVMTLSRLRTWAGFSPAEITELASSVEQARQRVPGGAALRSVAGVQTVLQLLPQKDIQRLFDAAPSVRSAVPAELRRALEAAAELRDAVPAGEAAGEQAQVQGKRFWEFWRR